MTGWKPSPLMVRILSAFVILAFVIGLVLAGVFGVYALVLIIGGLALWEFKGLSDQMGSRAPGWLLYPLGVFFAVRAIASSMRSCILGESSLRRPLTRMRTPRRCISSISRSIVSWKRRIRARTSARGRAQFSVEKA